MSCKCNSNCSCKATPVVDWTKPIQTRAGYNVRVLATELKHSTYTVAVAIMAANGSESVGMRTKNGAYKISGGDSELDIVNVPEKISGWLPLFKGVKGYKNWHPMYLFASEREANSYASKTSLLTSTYIGAVYIEKEVK